MHRPRQRHKTGCLRCRKRRKKCDESRPACRYCARWGLECIWPRGSTKNEPKSSTKRQQHSGSSSSTQINIPESQLILSSSTTLTGNVPNVDPFHTLPLRDNDDHSLGPRLLYDFFISITNANVPFDSSGTRSDMVAGLLESVLVDELACCALITYATKCSISRVSAPNEVLSLSFENRTLRLLRRQIESGAIVTEDLILAASVYFIAAALDHSNKLELRRMLAGINVLVSSCGGVGQVMQTMKGSTIMSVLTCDIFNSMLNADLHTFAALKKPSAPSTFETVYAGSVPDIDLNQYLSKDTVDLLNDFDFLLFFRHPSRQTRSLSPVESQYLPALSQWLDFRLGVLQHYHLGTGSFSETVLLAMILVKQEVVADGAEHSILILTLLERLKTAIQRCQTQDSTTSRIVCMWACVCALVGRTVLSARDFFFVYIRDILLGRYGQQSEWPQIWWITLRVELKQILWHEKIERRFHTICKALVNEELTPDERSWYNALLVPI